MEIVVVKELLPPTQYKYLNELFDSGDFEWHYRKHVHYVEGDDDNITSDSHGLMKMFYINNMVVNPNFDKVTPILFNLVDRLGKRLILIHRIHACLTININKDHNCYPHTDCDLPKMNSNWYTAIYYLGDSDGDTIFFEDDEKTVKHRQPFESNSAVVFNGGIKHSGMLPREHSNRIILNFNFEMEP